MTGSRKLLVRLANEFFQSKVLTAKNNVRVIATWLEEHGHEKAANALRDEILTTSTIGA